MHKLPFDYAAANEWRKTYPTPFYVYDFDGIKQRVSDVNAAFAWNKGYKEYFAVKATPTPAVLRLLASLGCGADCASVPEITLATRSGITGQSIMFTSNETRPCEYAAAEKAGAIINLDDITQINNLYNSLGHLPDTVCCRYNGTLDFANAFIGNSRESKFGMTEEQLFDALQILGKKGVRHLGIHAMLASCTLEPNYYPELAAVLFDIAVRLRTQKGIEIEFIDLAGGIGIPYKPDETGVDIFKIGSQTEQVYKKFFFMYGMKPRLCTEMGRFITGEYGYLVTTVVGQKHVNREYVGVDASACDLMRPAMYGAYHGVTVLSPYKRLHGITCDVVGPLCENNDKFARQIDLPEPLIGDMIVIHDAGAHGRSMGYNYNGRLRPAELMLQGGEVKLIRRAETEDDLFATLDVDELF